LNKRCPPTVRGWFAFGVGVPITPPGKWQQELVFLKR
jgi:hypothetical protein